MGARSVYASRRINFWIHAPLCLTMHVSAAAVQAHLSHRAALRAWFSSPSAPKTPPSMLNLLSFRPNQHESYKAYGQAFAKDVGSRRGGVAKLVGTVVGSDGRRESEDKVWDEVALAHYPSVWHFGDMVMGKDYQAINAKYRVPAIRGTAILCCNELDEDV